MNERIKKMLSYMEENGLDAFLISKAENIRYLSGFTGGEDARLLLTPNCRYIFTDSRYFEQVRRECPDWELVKSRPPGLEELQKVSSTLNRIGVESHVISYNSYCQLEQSLPNKLIPLTNEVERLRQVKDENELQMMRKAARIGDEVFSELCRYKIAPGISERELASEIVYFLRNKGCDNEAFATIALAGENAALPHGQPGELRLKSGDMLTLDFGGFYSGYAADMTRTVAITEALPEFQSRYRAVLEAQKLGVSLVKAGAVCREIDAAVRNCLQGYELADYFQHGTGHSLGLEIHEAPAISPRSDAVLEENMVVTVEPGIYIPGWGGIRIEDTVIVKNGGCEVITHSDKNLLII
jgi:Xaa-Pro aminopeptidase